jgi:homeodomain-containing protein
LSVIILAPIVGLLLIRNILVSRDRGIPQKGDLGGGDPRGATIVFHSAPAHFPCAIAGADGRTVLVHRGTSCPPVILGSSANKPPSTGRKGCRYARTTTTADHPHRRPKEDAAPTGAEGDLYPEARPPRSHRPDRRRRLQQRADRREARDKQGNISSVAWDMAGERRASWCGRGGFRKKLRQAMEEVLCDRPRSGAPPTFSAEQLCQIVAMACEAPSHESGRPVTHWSTIELADEAINRGIVEDISARSVGRFLKGGRSEASPGASVEAQ